MSSKSDQHAHAGPVVPRLPHMIYGGDYNPEQWPGHVWREDARLMRAAGVNLITLAVFSWAQLEPREGVYTFEWLDEVIAVLHEHGIMVCLATPTASPPPWLARNHPESLPVTAEGTTLWPGSRQQYCPSSAAYRDAAAALARRVAERYGNHPALALWHINNEYGAHVAACYCDASAAAFRAWLRRRYGTIEHLNAAWATAFWSQRYDDWEEILPPRAAPYIGNPAQQLDFMRFSSDALLACYEQERAIVKEITPDVPVTTNFMCSFKPLDYWRWAAREDVVSVNIYTDPAEVNPHVGAALNADLMRSLGHGRPWLITEQTPTRVNWRPHNLAKAPGQMRLWSMQAVARGADGIMFFQWRASRAGAEKFHGAMVPHGGIESSRVWRDVCALGDELRRLDAVTGTPVPAEVAMVLDWESWWALELDSKPSSLLRQVDALMQYYAPLFGRTIAVDFVRPGDWDLGRYRVLLVPNLYQARDGAGADIERFVAAGGALVMSFFSGIADEHDHVFPGRYPAPFRAVLGLSVEDFFPLPEGHTARLRTAGGDLFDCDLWIDRIALEGAAIEAAYLDGDHAGDAAVTRHAFGRGVAYYLGTRPDAAYMDALLARVCRDAGVRPALDAPAGVEAVRRGGGDRSFLFLLNHGRHTQRVPLDAPSRDLLTGAVHEGAITLEPNGVAILEAPPVQRRDAEA